MLFTLFTTHFNAFTSWEHNTDRITGSRYSLWSRLLTPSRQPFTTVRLFTVMVLVCYVLIATGITSSIATAFYLHPSFSEHIDKWHASRTTLTNTELLLCWIFTTYQIKKKKKKKNPSDCDSSHPVVVPSHFKFQYLWHIWACAIVESSDNRHIRTNHVVFLITCIKMVNFRCSSVLHVFNCFKHQFILKLRWKIQISPSSSYKRLIWMTFHCTILLWLTYRLPMYSQNT